jgi:glycosyltransferase involved in cell wall biosynthesis
MSTPLISVVLPVYNGELFLAEAIQSILDQTFVDFELIIINDGSTDKTIDVIKRFCDKRIVVIEQPNMGLPSALNNGILFSKGDFIARMDHDDVAIINRFEVQIAFLNNNPDVSVVAGAVTYIDESGKEISRSFPVTSFFAIKKYMLNFGCVISHPTVMMRKKDIDAVSGYSLAAGGRFTDYHLWVKLIRKGYKLINLPSVLLKYRLLDDSITSKFTLTETAKIKLHGILREENPGFEVVNELYTLCNNEINNSNKRIRKPEKVLNYFYNIIRFLNFKIAEGLICKFKNVIAFLK